MSKTITQNVLMNKHDIKETYQQIDNIPIIDSSNPKHIEEILGNHLRVLKDYPLGHDFCVNMIDKAVDVKRKTGIGVIADYSYEYYCMDISQNTSNEYFNGCSRSKEARQSMKRQLQKDLEIGFVVIHGKDKHGKYIERKAPFRIISTRVYIDTPTPETRIRLLLLKAVYGSLIEGNCTKNGGEGFCKIPEKFYPVCTNTKKRLLPYNSMYRMQILGLSKNTHKQSAIEIHRKETLRSIIPEYIDKDASLERESFGYIEKTLESQSKELIQILPKTPLVNKIQIRKYGDTCIFSFEGY
jgi:hypothetical protein